MKNSRSLKSLDFQLVSTKQSQVTPATLQSVQYRCQIVNNILRTQLHQTFITLLNNEYSETLYYFPIEDNICLQSFDAKYQDKTIRGVVKEKEQAQKEYQENKDQGNFVSYADVKKESDQDYVHIKLGNLPPNEQVEIVLSFSQQLGSILNKYYIAQIPLQFVKDEVSAKQGKSVLTLDLFCTGRITYAESISLMTQKTQIDENSIRFSLNQENLQQNHNFQIIFSFEGMFDPQVIFGSSKCYHEDKVKSSILPVSHSAMVTFIPNFNEDIGQKIDDTIRAALQNEEDITSDEFQQKTSIELIDHLNVSRSEFIFLLDRSGSMSGQGIQKACEALTLFLKSLPNESYFNVISFGSLTQMLFPQSLKYTTENMNKAIDIISKYTADLGGTNIYNPLEKVFKKERIKGYNKQIFLLTDGEVDSPQEVVGLVKKNNKCNRVHSIGFGSGADKYLIQQSAKAGKGISKIVEFNCDLSEVIIQMLQVCITPVLDDFSITFDQSIFDSTHPSTSDFPCVFKDEIINIHFFFKPLIDISSLAPEQKKILIEYCDSHKQKKIVKEISLEMSDSFTCNTELQESVFKLGKQLYLNENITPQNDKSELIQQAVDFQLLSEKTALICVIESLNDEQKVVFDNSSSNKVNEEEEIGIYDHYTNSPGYVSNIACNSPCIGYASPSCPSPSYSPTTLSENVQQSVNTDLKIKKKDRKLKSPIYEEIICYDGIEGYFEIENQLFDVYDTKQPSKIKDDNDKEQYLFIASNSRGECSQIEEDEKIIKDTSPKQKSLLPGNSQTKIEQKKEKEEEEEQKQQIRQVPIKQELQTLIKPKHSLNDLLKLVDSCGVWKYDQNLIEELGGLDVKVIEQFTKNFSEKDAFMTLFIVAILEMFYHEEKTKWVLIQKKSLNSIKKYCTGDIDSLKESLLLQIQQ